MIIVTGGAGMIGSNIIAALNALNETDILVVDHLKNGHKMENLADLDFKDYLDRDDFIRMVRAGTSFGQINAVFHMGACSTTTEWDGQYMMRNNFEYSKDLLNWCQLNNSQFLYASSASVYGLGHEGFKEVRKCERPINMYAFSKFQFDQYIRKHAVGFNSQVVGLRYFNVFGPREGHKGSMSSAAYHFNNQLVDTGKIKIFSGTEGVADGMQQRDFVYVKDCAAINLWLMENPNVSGIYNLGSGTSRTFNDVAKGIADWHLSRSGKKGVVEYIPFPEQLKGSYQNFTKADLSSLRNAGYKKPFYTLEEGISDYLGWLETT
jgi:ADP-L-glycero-D-manno-heptose 6-epimerase